MPPEFQQTSETLSKLLMVAWLAPLFGFAIEIFAGYWQRNRRSKTAAYLAVGCIGLGFICSLTALLIFRSEAHPKAFSGSFYTLAHFGDLKLSIDYYIDSLTLIMFTMVTLIATCIHIFAMGYMSDELTDEYVDHQAHTADGKHLHRHGRFHRFFAYMSLFCFSMLGIVIAGNIFMVFIFWELVGISSYLLIGFYTERKSASNAANKAFIMNRVGDFGFLIGLMIIWTSFGTFNFGEWTDNNGESQPGIFEMLRGEHGEMHVESQGGENVVLLNTGEHEKLADFGEKEESEDRPIPMIDPPSDDEILASLPAVGAGENPNADNGSLNGADGNHKSRSVPYWLLVVAGLGIFAGCIGKSAQFPLQTWLPDAMEGPTPVSALVHSATMVAAGVYLAGRFFPMFTPEVLLVIAYVGCITLFVAATIAVVATDIKRVLAYSTISQLGYMMLAIGVAGWSAGLLHLITHAFFKSLMFLCAGSVIVGCHHEQEMTRMGGLWRKMPVTAFTMLVGVIAISGLAIPGSASVLGETIAFSGYHSKDAIVATALAYTSLNSIHFLLFIVPLVTAGITAFYMFRLWFFTFAGKPRDQELHDHAHESPLVMTGPLIVLALFAAFVAFGSGAVGGGKEHPTAGLLEFLLESEPAGLDHGVAATTAGGIALPSHHDVHDAHPEAGMYALIVAALGALIAYVLYGKGLINPAEIKRQFAGVHNFLVEKWQFDRLYNVMFERPVHIVASWCTWVDKTILDGILHGAASITVRVAKWDRKFDEGFIDGLVNLVGGVVFGMGARIRNIQTGRLRQYIMFIAVGVLTLFVLLFTLMPK